MKYIRVILAVEEDDLNEAYLDLDEYIEDDDRVGNVIQGAHVSTPYSDRESALHDPTFESHVPS